MMVLMSIITCVEFQIIIMQGLIKENFNKFVGPASGN